MPRNTTNSIPLLSPTTITPAKPACSAIKLVIKKNKQYLRSVNGTSDCTSPDCVLRTKGRTHKAPDS
ncbi:hypothetical protein PS6_010555 [Mucor atramentarius]